MAYTKLQRLIKKYQALYPALSSRKIKVIANIEYQVGFLPRVYEPDKETFKEFIDNTEIVLKEWIATICSSIREYNESEV